MAALLGAVSVLIGTGASGALAQGALTVRGSDTMLILGQAWAQGYMKARPGHVVTVAGGGSTTGITALINGSTDVCQSSRKMQGSELDRAKARGFVPFEIPVARDGLAIIVNPNNPLDKITFTLLRGIFNGSITNWKQVGGADRPVIAIGRDSTSGTYGFFQDIILGVGRPYRADMRMTPATSVIGQIVAQDERAIGYVGIAYAKAFGNKVKILPVSRGNEPAQEPTDENVRSGKYPLWRYLYFYMRRRPSGAAKDFIDWVRSPEGQAIAEQVGYYRL